jgi:hypothetical protein
VWSSVKVVGDNGKVSARAEIQPSLETNVGSEALQGVAGESLATYCHFLWKRVARPAQNPPSRPEVALGGQGTGAIAPHGTASAGIGLCDPRARVIA